MNNEDQLRLYFLFKVFFYMYAVVPFSLLIIFNCLIIIKATQFARARRVHLSQASTSGANPVLNLSRKRKTEMTRTIIIVTFLFVVLSVPSAFATFYYNQLVVLDIGPMLITLLDDIQFSFPAFNFIILYFTNKLFAQEVKSTLIRPILNLF